jgi:hypothetical protein
MNCKKYIQKATIQKNTWLKTIPSYIQYYHVIGDCELDKDFIFDQDTHTLWLKVEDDYNSLPKKVIAAYYALLSTFQFKYMFKTDDDQILNDPGFFDMLRTRIEGTHPVSHYGGFIIDIKQPHRSQYHLIHPELPKHLPIYPTMYCSGRFYFLSYASIQDLVAKRLGICREYFEDYAIGRYLAAKYKEHIMFIPTSNYFTDIPPEDITV